MASLTLRRLTKTFDARTKPALQELSLEVRDGEFLVLLGPSGCGETAQRLGLTELLDRLPAQLSGGQRQRVALGRAIVRAPRAFLFDEPLSNLDAQLRSELRRELLGLHRALGATMVYVTHDQVEAMTMGQRIAVLYEGRLRQLGTPVDVYQRPA